MTQFWGSALDVALRAIALGLEGRARGMMTGSAGGLFSFRCFVQRGLEIQRGLRVLFEQRFMTGAAIGLRTFQVRGVVKGDIAVLGGKGEFLGSSLLLLSNQSEHSAQAHGQQTRNECTHVNKGSTSA
jgi:hypothetical protein